jgi:hypothetical protein
VKVLAISSNEEVIFFTIASTASYMEKKLLQLVFGLPLLAVNHLLLLFRELQNYLFAFSL